MKRFYILFDMICPYIFCIMLLTLLDHWTMAAEGIFCVQSTNCPHLPVPYIYIIYTYIFGTRGRSLHDILATGRLVPYILIRNWEIRPVYLTISRVWCIPGNSAFLPWIVAVTHDMCSKPVAPFAAFVAFTSAGIGFADQFCLPSGPGKCDLSTTRWTDSCCFTSRINL